MWRRLRNAAEFEGLTGGLRAGRLSGVTERIPALCSSKSVKRAGKPSRFPGHGFRVEKLWGHYTYAH